MPLPKSCSVEDIKSAISAEISHFRKKGRDQTASVGAAYGTVRGWIKKNCKGASKERALRSIRKK